MALSPDQPLPEQEAPQGMSDSELVSYCNNQISQADGGTTEGSDKDVDTAMNYYLGRYPVLSEKRAKDPNASRFVSMDVMDGIEATIAEIMPSFSTEEIAFYKPLDKGDEQQAKTESDIVNDLFFEEYDGFTLLQVAIKSALLHKNATVKCYWDERVEVEYETFDNVPELALQQILQPESEDQTIEVVEQIVEQEADPAAQLLVEEFKNEPNRVAQIAPEEQGMAQEIMQASQAVYSVKIKRMTKVGRPMIISVPPEQAIVQAGHDSVYLHNCGFVAHELLETESSLIAQGYDPDIVKELPDHDAILTSNTRNRNAEESDYSSTHHSTRKIRIFECYPEVDFDGDNIAERRKVVISGNKLLSNEEFSGMAMVGGAAMLNPYKYKGISMFERLRGIQDAKTPVMRSIVDGTQLSSNPRIGVVTGSANVDDILTSRTGGVVRFNAGGAGGVFEMPNPQIPQSSYTFLEHMDNARRDRGGGAVDSSSQGQAIGSAQGGAHGIERIMSKMELNNALLARNMGETLVRGIFIELHNLLRKNFPKGRQIEKQIGGRWLTTTPSEWRKRTNVTVQVADSVAERARQSNMLGSVLEIQGMLKQAGSTMVNEQKGYAAISDKVRLGGIRSPERYFVDPQSEEGQKASQAAAQQAQMMKQIEQMVTQKMVEAQEMLGKAEMTKAQADLQSNQVKFENDQLTAQIDQLKIKLDTLSDRQDLQFDYAKLAEDVALKLTEMEYTANKDLSAEKESNKPEQ